MIYGKKLNNFQTQRKNEQTIFAVYYTTKFRKMSINQFQFAKGSLEDACHRSSPLNKKFESEKLNIPEINYTKDMMKHDIESIGRWYNIRRDKLLLDLIKLDEDYQQIVQEYTHKWTEQIAKLYATTTLFSDETPFGFPKEYSDPLDDSHLSFNSYALPMRGIAFASLKNCPDQEEPIWQKKCRVMRAMSDGELIPTEIGMFHASEETTHTVFTPSFSHETDAQRLGRFSSASLTESFNSYAHSSLRNCPKEFHLNSSSIWENP